MLTRKTSGAAALLSILLAGCAAPPPPPITSLNTQQCTPAGGEAAARILPFGDENAVTVEIGGDFPCHLGPDGKPFVEIAFQLPVAKEPYLLRVMSLPRGGTMFAPRLELTDDTRRVTKEVGPDNFQIHGPSLSTIVRAQPNDRFLMIRSNGAAVGNQQTHISEWTTTTMATTGTAIFIVRTGSEGQETYTLAYNGRLRVSATPMPTSVPAAITGSSGSRPNP